MINPWRLGPLAVLLSLTFGIVAAQAQTVIVRDAPKGAAIQVQLNADTPMSVAADANGDANVPVISNVDETSVRVYVDLCGSLVQVHLVEQGVVPPAAEGACTRKEPGGIMIMRRVTTFVVDLGGPEPAVHLRQGPAPAAWLRRGAAPATWRTNTPPKGLVLFGGGGLATFSDFLTTGCGNVPACSESGSKGALTAGAGYWFMPFVGAQVSYLKPGDHTLQGSSTGFTFTSGLVTEFVTVTGTAGGPIGPFRIYGLGGLNHHRATFTTTETTEDRTVTVDATTQTLPGGTQTLSLRTSGWGWLLGGGVEIWASRRVAIYAEYSRAALKGTALGGGEGALKDQVASLLAGAKVRIGR